MADDKYCSVRFKTGQELDEALAAALTACDEAERATSCADRAEAALGKGPVIQEGLWWVYDCETEQYVNTGISAVGTDGLDGYSPIVTVVTITGGHRVSITDKNGTQTFDVMDGEDGVGTGGSGGDMVTATYDPDGAVAQAGGIKAYVSDVVDDLDVPAVTTDDNGKFLRVVNGAWAAEALPNAEGGAF